MTTSISMSPPIIAPSAPVLPVAHSPKSGRWVLKLLLLVMVMGFVFLGVAVYGITSFIRLGSDARALRNGILGATPEPWRHNFEVNVGGVTTSLAKAGLAFAPLPPEARGAVSAVRAGEVGVYDLTQPIGPETRAAMLDAADKVMERRGWERIVGVIERDSLVAVYLPHKTLRADDFKACVAVVAEGRLVIASARSDLAPLIRMAKAEAAKHGDPTAKKLVGMIRD
jgi:hypothetical protein